MHSLTFISYFLFYCVGVTFKLQISFCLSFGNTIHHENEEEFFYEISMHGTNYFEGFVEAKDKKHLLREKNCSIYLPGQK